MKSIKKGRSKIRPPPSICPTTLHHPPKNQQHLMKKNEGKPPKNDIITLNVPEATAEANNTMTQRIIEVVTVAFFVNNNITTPIILQIRPSKGSSNLNVLKAYENIFTTMKLIDPPLKLITF